MNPTVVLVQGACTDATRWQHVTRRLRRAGHRVIEVANPLRNLPGDAAYLSSVLASISGPIVLAGHAYGGVVATDAATDHDNVKALVYVASIAPDKGESGPDLTGRFPGTLLDQAIQVNPASGAAHGEPCGEPAWRFIPSWFIYSRRDPVIPVEASRFMADRASAQESVELPGAAHPLPASRPQAVAGIILRAAAAV
ncbi:alpha/beta hydrolase [Micromonospora gifhornensis]|uniref:Alpha/beta hydrolase n=1 Tax=Micromonospora gifhornensis TaxID=84594 RepID=A0ABQ4IJL0_9ACTN|nr:alpha/beta hydrolase [Micromonospora gifhornensis]GIJ18092.1 alpha/beta hydrolase [Micromonospora gifhornensis]